MEPTLPVGPNSFFWSISMPVYKPQTSVETVGGVVRLTNLAGVPVRAWI